MLTNSCGVCGCGAKQECSQADGTVLVADSRATQVIKFSPNGTELLRLTAFSNPTGVSASPSGK